VNGTRAVSRHGLILSLTLPGSIGSWPIGLETITNYASILLCEGGPDLLAAHQFICAEDRQADAAAIALLGSSNKPDAPRRF
jgi:hypothetical protein